jgi:hypothetical protein
MNTEKERQHYIPKFYLRNFSFCNNKKQIGIYNLLSNVFIQKAKLKNQGYKPYYYGKDGQIENILSKVESDVAPLIAKIIATNELPKRQSDDYQELLAFTVLTDIRNPIVTKNIFESNAHLEKFINVDSDEEGDVQYVLPDITEQEAVDIAFSIFETSLASCADLDYKLLINTSKTPFITSDIPLIKYNQYLEYKKSLRAKNGYGNIGIQLFLPLSPTKMILFYDSMIYKVGDRKKDFIELNSEHEITQFNILQILNCQSILFFGDTVNNYYINDIVSSSKKFTKANLTESRILPKMNDQGEIMKNENAIFITQSSLSTKLTFSNITLTKNAKSRQFDNGTAQIRPRIRQLLDLYSR